MFRKSRDLVFLTAALLLLCGCVAKNDYLRKQAEADALKRDMAVQNVEGQGLRENITNLQKNIKKLHAEISDLRTLNENLTSEQDRLNTRMNTLRTETNRTIEALSNRNIELEADKQMLEESIAQLKKSKDELMNRNIELEGEKQMLEESIAQLKKSKDELMNRNTELESDRQLLEESIAMLKESKEAEETPEAAKAPEEREDKEAEVNTVSGTYENLIAEMKSEIEQGQISIIEFQGKLTMDVMDDLLFDSGRTDIKPKGLAILKRVAKILMTVTDKSIRIEGHTDNIPIKGALAKRYATNREFSAARALNVARCLEKEGIDSSTLSASAFGEYKPAAENDTPEGRAKNRRIAIVLLPNE